jgi:hypothetical protein
LVRTILCSAALAVAVVPVDALAQGATPSASPSPQDVKKATDAFKQGSTLYAAKKWALALAQFKLSYDTVPSPNSLLFVARCQNEMGDPKESYRTFERVIAEAEARAAEKKYEPTKESAKVELGEVATKIALLTVNVTRPKESTRVRVGGAPLAQDQWGKALPFDPGPLEIVLESDGDEPVTEKVDLVKGDKKVVELATPEPKAAPPPPEEPKPEPSGGPSGLMIGALVAGGVGVAGMVMFGVAGGMSLSTYSEVEDKCSAQPGGRCTSAADLELIDRGEQEQVIANVGLVIGSVGLATGATLLIVDLAGGGGSSQEAAKRPIDLDVGPGYVGVRGRF